MGNAEYMGMSSILKTHPLLKIVSGAVYDLPTPSNIRRMWNFGSLLGLCLIVQILTGLFLSMHYSRDASIAFSRVSHISRDKLWVITSDISCQWGQIFFHVSISTRRSRFILWVLQLYTYMKHWSSHSPRSNSYSILRVCSPMRANIILRGNCDYQSVFDHPVYWRRSCSVNMRGLCRRQRNSNSLFFSAFYTTICYRGDSWGSLVISSPNREYHPPWIKWKLR